jgi:hypothetical protein
VIGAFQDDHEGGTNAGSAYVFSRNGTTWSEAQKFIASDAATQDLFGASVALSGDTLVVGSLQDDIDGGGVDAGSAYTFALLPGSPVSYCTSGTSTSGCQAVLSASGIASASALSGFDLLASSVEGAKDGIFFFGTNGRQANPWGNGTSYTCVVPPVKRCGLLPGTGTTGSCDGSTSQDLNALWCPVCPKPGLNPGPGVAVQAQLWYRDPLSTSNLTTSMSDAIEFVTAL